MSVRVVGWCTVLLLAAAPAAVAQDDSGADGVPCPPAKPRVSLADRAAPTGQAYLAAVNAAQRTAAQHMSPQNIAELDRRLGALTRKAAGADVGTILLSINDVPAAVYATAISAKRDPADGTTANNLGAALKVARSYESAFTVLLAADARQPESPVILTNLGNVAFALGDGGAAGAFYRAATKAAADHPGALAGLGNLALCQGDRAGAARYFRKALSQMYLPAARAGLQAAGARGGAGASPGAGAAPGGAVAQDTPFEHPAGKGGGQGLSLPEPPVTGSARATAASAGRLQELATDAVQQMADVSQRLATITPSMGAAPPDSGGSSRRVTAVNRFEKEQLALDDMLRIFDDRLTRRVANRMTEPMEILLEIGQRDADILQRSAEAANRCENDRCQRAVELQRCEDRHTLADQAHAKFLPVWRELWQGTAENLNDYYAFSSPWLQDLHDPAANQLYNLTREAYVLSKVAPVYAVAQSEADTLAMLLEDDCTKLALPPSQPDTRPLKAWPDDPAKCRTPPLSISAVVASVEGTCDAVKFSLNSGVGFMEAEYSFGAGSNEDQITVWAGGGGEIDTPIPRVGASAKSGPYVTYKLGADGNTPSLGDWGWKSEAGATLDLTREVGPVKVGAIGEAKATGLFSVETGITADFTSEVKAGVGPEEE